MLTTGGATFSTTPRTSLRREGRGAAAAEKAVTKRHRLETSFFTGTFNRIGGPGISFSLSRGERESLPECGLIQDLAKELRR
jgi:hypothetical protein